MSRTVLLSEVQDVTERFPAMIADLREVLLQTGLPEDGRETLPVLAERVTGDTGFREQLHAAVNGVCEQEPFLSQLEVLGVLVAAAAGPEEAEGIAEAPGLDGPARVLFTFVLESRRRRREFAGGAPGPSLEGAPQGAAVKAAPVLERVESLEIPQVQEAEMAVPEPKARVTATSPGDSAMLARALAMVADEPEPVAVEPALPDAPEPAVRPHLASGVHSLRGGRRQRERLAPRPMPVKEIAEDEEEVAGPPRRWGMGTAAVCGVLLGFGLGVFLHFDHRATPLASRPAAARATQPLSAAPSGRVKSIDELQAEIAALDSVAGVTASEGDSGVARGRTSGPRGNARPGRADRKAAKDVSSPARPGEEHGPVLMVSDPAARSARPVLGGGASAPAPGSNVALHPLPPIRSVSLSGPAVPASGSGSPTATAHAPHVVTGSAGIMAANLVTSPAPAYPAAASAAGVQGDVVVEAVVGRDGEVLDTRVVSGPPLLRAAALDAVQRWHYRPYQVDGKPIEIATTARLEFRLDQ